MKIILLTFITNMYESLFPGMRAMRFRRQCFSHKTVVNKQHYYHILLLLSISAWRITPACHWSVEVPHPARWPACDRGRGYRSPESSSRVSHLPALPPHPVPCGRHHTTLTQPQHHRTDRTAHEQTEAGEVRGAWYIVVSESVHTQPGGPAHHEAVQPRQAGELEVGVLQ